jgi:hypothetical protein
MREFIKSQYENRPDVLGAVLIERGTLFFQLTEGVDALALMITQHHEGGCRTHHYSKDKRRIQERWYDRETLERLADNGGSAIVQQCLMVGEIVLDTNEFLANTKEKLLRMSPIKRKQRLISEFSAFLRNLVLSKTHMEHGDLLDAHSHILTGIHHWARLSIVEQDHVPELTLWKQVRKLNPGIFKLYEELTMSGESLEQRIRLAHLACEFSVMSKLEEVSKPLLEIMSSRSEPWSTEELEERLELQASQVDLQLLLKKLVGKSLIKEVCVPAGGGMDLLELRYSS